MRALLIVALAAPAGIQASPPDRVSESPRFGVKANLQATAPALADARFRLQASLAPRQGQVSMEAVGFALKATLQSKGGGPICFGPGHVFANGFETPET